MRKILQSIPIYLLLIVLIFGILSTLIVNPDETDSQFMELSKKANEDATEGEDTPSETGDSEDEQMALIESNQSLQSTKICSYMTSLTNTKFSICQPSDTDTPPPKI